MREDEVMTTTQEPIMSTDAWSDQDQFRAACERDAKLTQEEYLAKMSATAIPRQQRAPKWGGFG